MNVDDIKVGQKFKQNKEEKSMDTSTNFSLIKTIKNDVYCKFSELKIGDWFVLGDGSNLYFKSWTFENKLNINAVELLKNTAKGFVRIDDNAIVYPVKSVKIIYEQ